MSQISVCKRYKCGCGTWEQGWKRGVGLGITSLIVSIKATRVNEITLVKKRRNSAIT